MGYAKYAVFITALSLSCSTTTDSGGWKISDAQITFFARGQHIVISDSGGFEAERMIAGYSHSDSLFEVFGRNRDIMLSFVFRTPRDTGVTLLDLPSIRFYYDPPSTIPLRLDGNAMVYFSDGAFSTDSLHTGVITITQVDTANGTFSGAFSFSAIDTTKGSLFSDTIRVDSGVITKMRFDYP